MSYNETEMTLFSDRFDAGRQLAHQLEHFRDDDVVVLGLPRGGVPVAFEVARELNLPLDVIIVRKLGVPFQPELAMGAIGENGVRILNDDVVRLARITTRDIAMVERAERAELERRVVRFRDGRPRINLHGQTAVLVDDGIATGSTARAACRVARALGAARVVVAVPVAAPESIKEVSLDADEVVCLQSPPSFHAVGAWYRDFTQTGDAEVVRLLEASRDGAGTPIAGAAVGAPIIFDDEVVIHGEVDLAGRLSIPAGVSGVVLFAHGSGSSRHSPRNRYVASRLNDAGFATLLLDLLTPREELDRSNVFDIDLLARRLGAAAEWLERRPDTAGLPVGLFGASTGAGAALVAAAELGPNIFAVVSRGGRPDLAGDELPRVQAPTLLIVGGDDPVVLDLNRQALARLTCEARLSVVPGATHLFEEPGTLASAAELAGDWFRDRLASRAASPG